MKEYTQGACGDGAAILKNGVQMTIDEIFEALRREDTTIDEDLKQLIADTDLMEIVCCLDMIAQESGSVVKMFKDDKQEYPVL